MCNKSPIKIDQRFIIRSLFLDFLRQLLRLRDLKSKVFAPSSIGSYGFLSNHHHCHGWTSSITSLLYKTLQVPFICVLLVSAQSLTVVRLSQLNAGDLFSFAMWTLQSCAITPSGGRTSLLVAPSQYGDLIFGAEIPTGQAVAFTLPQCFESEFITLYDVIRTNEKVGDAILLQLDDLSTWYPSNPKSDKDLQFAHDVCSGLGGFSTAFSYLGGSILCAVDSCPLACDAYSRIFSAPCICSDIGSMSTIRSMHDLQHAQHCQAMMFAGFPCQPLSQQGAQLRAADPRSKTLHSVLLAAALLRVSCLLLECVPEALKDPGTQAALMDFCNHFGYNLCQTVLHLHSVWPSKRSRWFAVCSLESYGICQISGFPVLVPSPAIRDVIGVWPSWNPEEEQLAWTPLENEMYGDPRFGSTDRRIGLSSALPTALHSWGSALYACPCKCRSAGFSLQRLQRSGLRGVVVVSQVLGCNRHIHPKELQFLLGFPPIQPCGDHCRAFLCLLGNSVSPIQALWIISQVVSSMSVNVTIPSVQALQQYLKDIVKQQALVWPSNVQTGTLQLVSQGVSASISFKKGAKVRDLLKAEAIFQQQTFVGLSCAGVWLPEEAYLNEYTYVLVSSWVPLSIGSLRPVQCQLWFLGSIRRLVVAAGMTVAQVVEWQRIPDWQCIVSPNGLVIDPASLVQPGQDLVVQTDPEEMKFGLDFKIQELIGLGFGSLQLSSSWTGLGLGHLDELVKNNVLASWSGSKFAPLALWLPSFAAAVIEVWPNTIESSLRSWFLPVSAEIFVMFQDGEDWNLMSVKVDRLTMTISFFNDCRTEVAGLLAYRIMRAGDRACYREVFPQVTAEGPKGSLAWALNIVDGFLAVPQPLRCALAQVREKYGAASAFGSFGQLSATLPLSMPNQLPISREEFEACDVVGGLSAPFILDFARALARQFPATLVQDQIRVLVVSEAEQKQLQGTQFHGGPAPLFLFVLCDKHWTLLHCVCHDSELCITQYDGLGSTSIAKLDGICRILKTNWEAEHYQIETTWQVPQRRSDSCGTIALGHFAWCLGIISEQEMIGFEDIHPSLALCSEKLSPDAKVCGFRNDQEVTQALHKILPDKGVAPENIQARIQAAVKVLGVDQLSKALGSKNQWGALKALGNSKPRPFKWVTNEELQHHIQERAAQKFGVDADVKRTKKQRDQRKPALSAEAIDTSSLILPPEVFITSTGSSVGQIQLAEVLKDACGVAFAHASDIVHFLQEGKLISPEALGLLVVGKIPDQFISALPMHSIRVPAIYKGTNEPVLLDCVSIQLGDQAIYRKQSKTAPVFAVFPTVVFRVHVFRDLWEEDAWPDLVRKPIRQLVSTFGKLQLCRDPNCAGTCNYFHPSIEEDGVESGLLDVWGFAWHKLDGGKAQPESAEVLSVFIRVPESNFNSLHFASGYAGVFFEPRLTDQPGPDPKFAVVWVPQQSLGDITHKVKTLDLALAACRLGAKYGIRCLAKNQEDLHKSLNLKKPFVSCAVKQVYRIEPLPAGTQRQSIADICKHIGWVAKPLQACKGSQGRAWEIGAETAPPVQFIDAQHGWTTLTKIRDVSQPIKPVDLVATSKTKQHIRAGPTSSASSSAATDPWFNGADPWGQYQGVSSAPPPSQHVQKKFDDVEQRLQESVAAQVTESVQQAAAQFTSNDRIAIVENQMHALTQSQSNLETCMQDGRQKMQEFHQNQEKLQHVVGQCATTIQAQGATLNQVVQDVATCSNALKDQESSLSQVVKEVGGLKDALGSQLASYFEQQSSKLEALLEKKQRTS